MVQRLEHVSSAIDVRDVWWLGELTLCEDEVVLLDKRLECVLVELLDIGASSNGRKEGGADS
jgi:hypothetical protein